MIIPHIPDLSRPGSVRRRLLRERSGFRESWLQNGRIMFDGAPVRLKGSNCGGGELVGGDDVQRTRGSDGVEDYLDEFGCLAGYYPLSSWRPADARPPAAAPASRASGRFCAQAVEPVERAEVDASAGEDGRRAEGAGK